MEMIGTEITYDEFVELKQNYKEQYQERLEELLNLIYKDKKIYERVYLIIDGMSVKVEFEWLADDLLELIDTYVGEVLPGIEDKIAELKKQVEKIEFVGDKLIEWLEEKSEQKLKEELEKVEKAFNLLSEVFGKDIEIEIKTKKNKEQ